MRIPFNPEETYLNRTEIINYSLSEEGRWIVYGFQTRRGKRKTLFEREGTFGEILAVAVIRKDFYFNSPSPKTTYDFKGEKTGRNPRNGLVLKLAVKRRD